MTIEEGKKLQAKELEAWKKLLNPVIFTDLEKCVKAVDDYENDYGFLRDGNDVCCGGRILEILCHIHRINL
jgi:hypothetical protein